MVNPAPDSSPENHADYVRALQVIDEVVTQNYGQIYESTMRELGGRVIIEAMMIKNGDSHPRSIDIVDEAERITRHTGNELRDYVLKQAEEITIITGSLAPQAMFSEIDIFLTYGAEVAELGEELREDEYLDDTIAEDASRYMLVQEVLEKYAKSHYKTIERKPSDDSK